MANVLFDDGSDGGLFKADIQEAVDLAQLNPQYMGLTTATGTIWNNFDRVKIRFLGQSMGEREMINLSAIAIN